MGCFMNILWLMFGGIITASAYFFPFPALAFLGLPIPVSCETFCQFLGIHATFSLCV